MQVIHKHLDSLVRLLFPVLCKACGREVFSKQNQLCFKCLEQLPYTGFEKHPDNPIYHLFAGRLDVQQAFSYLYFHQDSITQAVVHRIKYKGDLELGIFMGECMGKAMAQLPHYANLEAVIPLPLNEKKLKQRGYNQSDLIAKGIARAMQLPVDYTAVMRSQYTQTQTKKSRLQRWQNVEQVFALQPNHSLDGKHVLLVDDVITTGATMEAMGRVLLTKPNIKLSVASLAYASPIN